VISTAFLWLTARGIDCEPWTKVLEASREDLGKKHPDTLVNTSNLATIYMNLGRPEEAEALYAEVLDIMETDFGRQHLSTVVVSNNLAAAYGKLGKFKEAEAILIENLNTLQQKCGQDHPDTVITSGRLAMTYHGLGKEAEAKEYGRHFVEIGKAVCGESDLGYMKIVQKLAEMGITVEED
jgi:tetratricopeptide (TPR) repeat protein